MDSDRPNQSLTTLKQIDFICDHFEQALQAGGGEKLESFLVDANPKLSRPLFEALLRAESSFRLEKGETPNLDEYQARFPQYQDILTAVLSETGKTVADPKRQPVSSATSAFPKVGDRIQEFEILDVIDEGGSGTVFRAWQHGVERAVALKITRMGSQEPRMMAQLDGHPNIVRIYDYRAIPERNLHLVSMEFVDGVTLHDKIIQVRRGEASPDWPSQVCEIGAQIADALEFAHRHRGIRHGDIKPKNVMLTHNGAVKLLDFNAAQRAGTELTELVGTLPYMSPEQRDAFDELNEKRQMEKFKQLDGRSDLYSLGLVLWELLLGHRPTQRVLAKVADGSFSLPTNVPTSLPHILIRCLQRTVDDRYATANELAHHLRLATNAELQNLLYPPPQSRRVRILHWPYPLLILVLLGLTSNLVVSALSIVWNLIVAKEFETFKDSFVYLWVPLVNGFAYVTGGIIALAYGWPVIAGLRDIETGKITHGNPALVNRALNVSHFVALMTLILWSISSVVWALVVSREMPRKSTVLFSGSVWLEGAIAAPLVYFPMAYVCTRVFIPRLVRQSHLPPHADLERQQNVYLGLLLSGTALCLMLFLLVGESLHGFRPLLMALLLLGVFGYAFALYCSREIRTNLRLLSLLERSSHSSAVV